MRTTPVQKRSASPIPEEDLGRYLASVFSSRFFVRGSQKEKRDWIQTRFPFWIEAARRTGDEILREGKTEEVRSPKPAWGKWRRDGADSPPKNGPSFEDLDRLLRLGKAYWSGGDPIYRDKIIAKIDEALSEGLFRKRRSLSGGALWKGIWLLYFLAGDAATPNQRRLVSDLWRSLREGASQEPGAGAEKGLFLLMMGTLFLELPQAPSWTDQGRRLLEEELLRSVGSDGVCRSGRLSDQVGLVQIYLQALAMGRVGDQVGRRVERALEFLGAHRSYALLPPAEAAPLFSLGRDETGSVEKTLALGAILFERGDLKEEGDPYSEEAFFITGPEGYAVHRRLASPSRSRSIVFEEGGYAVLRAAALDPPAERGLIFRAGAHSPLKESGPGDLSFSLLSRASVSGGHGSSGGDPPFLARLHPSPDRAFPDGAGAFSRRFLGEDFDYLEVRRLQSGSSLSIRRKILFVRPDYWMVDDSFSGEGTLRPEWAFLYPSRGWAQGSLEEGVHLQSSEGGRLWIVPLGTHLKDIEIQGRDEEQEVRVRCAGTLPLSLTTLLYPEASSSPCRHDFRSLYFPSAAGGTAFETLTATRTDTVLVAPPAGRIALRSIRFEGELLFVRRDYSGEISRVFVVSGRSCMWEGKLLFESQRPIPFLELSYAGALLRIRGELSGPVSLHADGVEEVRVNGGKVCFTRRRERLILHGEG